MPSYSPRHRDSPFPKKMNRFTKKWEQDKPLYIPVESSNPKKKGMVYVKREGKTKLIHFGDATAEDYRQHRDKDRRESYLKRSAKIRDKNGKLTANNKNFANYWSRNYLW
jgi:hypothetical protein